MAERKNKMIFSNAENYVKWADLSAKKRIEYCETCFIDYALFDKAIEFYNLYFGYKKNPINRDTALQLAQLGTRLDADLFKTINPTTEEGLNNFYKITPFYFFHGILKYMTGLAIEMEEEVLGKNMSPVLNFGGGCGGINIFLAEHNVKSIFFEVNKLQVEWMKWITRQRNLDIKIITNFEDLNNEDFKLVLFYDVLEHLINPEKTLQFVFDKKVPIIFTPNLLEEHAHKFINDELTPMHFEIKYKNNQFIYDLAKNLEQLATGTETLGGK